MNTVIRIRYSTLIMLFLKNPAILLVLAFSFSVILALLVYVAILVIPDKGNKGNGHHHASQFYFNPLVAKLIC